MVNNEFIRSISGRMRTQKLAGVSWEVREVPAIYHVLWNRVDFPIIKTVSYLMRPSKKMIPKIYWLQPLKGGQFQPSFPLFSLPHTAPPARGKNTFFFISPGLICNNPNHFCVAYAYWSCCIRERYLSYSFIRLDKNSPSPLGETTRILWHILATARGKKMQ